MQFKHSRAAGHVPNLMPGEVGVNLADGIIYVRSRGRKLAIPVDDFNAGAAPSHGAEGAPLVRQGDRIEFGFGLVPSSVLFGRIHVDAPPVDGYEVPGRYITAVAASMHYDAEECLVEPFEVASDDFTLTKMFFTLSAVTGALRIGITAEDGTILHDALITSPTTGQHTESLSLALAPGRYYGLLWSEGGMTPAQLQIAVPEQGWSFDEDTQAPLFLNRYTSGPTDLFAGLELGVLNYAQSNSPGEQRSILYDWTLG